MGQSPHGFHHGRDEISDARIGRGLALLDPRNGLRPKHRAADLAETRRAAPSGCPRRAAGTVALGMEQAAGRVGSPRTNATAAGRPDHTRAAIAWRLARIYGLRLGHWLYPIAGSLDRCAKIISISFARTSESVAVSDSQRISRRTVKSRRCSRVKSARRRRGLRFQNN